MSKPAKLKILCLHGYRQNEKAFREKSGGFRKICKKYVSSFEFIEAQHLVQTSDAGEVRSDQENNELNQKGWWFSRKDGYYKSTHESGFDDGLNQSLEQVSQALVSAKNSETGPYDGVVAFSQGACLLSVICHKIAHQDQREKFPFRFAMFFSGFKSAGTCHAEFYSKTISGIPTFHSVGLADQVVAAERGLELAKLYEEAVVMEHDGGHLIPNNSPEYSGLTCGGPPW